MPPEPEAPDAPPPSRLKWLIRKFWYLHSSFALVFGVGVMLFARHGLTYANELLIALTGSWLLVFVGFRFIVGPANRKPDEKLHRRGLRLATNYIIKQFYQQMFFFLVPIYASSATWSLGSWNWWLAPILLVCGVLSTMDLVFDHFIMERRLLASAMYGVAMFALLNVLGPLVFKVSHLDGLVIAAAATPTAVALLSFSMRTVMSPQGVILTLGATGVLLLAVWFGRVVVPPAPLAMPETAVGHGTMASYECLPASAHVMRASQLDGLRCGSWLEEPGGIKDEIVHVWEHDGEVVAKLAPTRVPCDDGGVVFRSYLPMYTLPHDPRGHWTCRTMTKGGQLVGLRNFDVIAADAPQPDGLSSDGGVPPADAAP